MNRDPEIGLGEAPGGDTSVPAASSSATIPILGAPLALVLTLLITFALYLPILHYSFSPADDASNVLSNPYLSDPSVQNIGYFFRHPFYYMYMPMTFSFWALCARIAPLSTPIEVPLRHFVSYLNPLVFHAASLGLHLASTALVFALLRRLRFLPWACAAGALVFAVHPVQVESVAWVTGANNLTAAFFGLLSLNLYLLALPDDPRQDQPGTARAGTFLALATMAFICALLSKPTATVLPFLAAVMEAAVFRRPWRRWIGLLLFWCLLSVACALVSRVATGGGAASGIGSPLWERPFVVGDALAFYLTRLAAPMITLDYARPPQDVTRHWWGYIDWLTPVIAFGALWFWPRVRRRSRDEDTLAAGAEPSWPRVAVLLFLFGIMATVGLVPFYSQWYSTVADRYMYLAMLGPALLAAHLSSRQSSRSSLRIIAAAVVIIVFGSLTALQLPVWRSPYSYVEYMVMTEPGTPFVHGLVGDVLYYHGDYASALHEYVRAQTLWQGQSPVNLQKVALTLMQLKRYDDAVKPMTDCVLADPANDTAWLQLWALLPHARHPETLETTMHQCLDVNPRDGKAAFTLGAIRLYRGSATEALPYLSLGAESSPDFGGMQYDFGVMLEGMNRLSEAEAQYRRALSADPRNRQAADALNLLRRRMGQ